MTNQQRATYMTQQARKHLELALKCDASGQKKQAEKNRKIASEYQAASKAF